MNGRGNPKGELHPRNRHVGRYDFKSLIIAYPELKKFVALNQYGDLSIDFANPEAVKALNRALLQKFYHIETWDIPDGFLCPPIPGRADYIHLLADLLAEGKEVPRGPQTKILDIGVGANCIYPLIGNSEYGWSYLGSDINPRAIQNAEWIIRENKLEASIKLHLQKDAHSIFTGVIRPGDFFTATSCNPPFHSSLAEAQKGATRKWKNLGKQHEKQKVNFGGQEPELWCEGGEVAFILTMIEESSNFRTQVKWFSTLVSKEESLPQFQHFLKKIQARRTHVLGMEQGQKKSRVLAWTFHA